MCEGSVTEIEYYRHIKAVLRDSLLTMSIVYVHSDPFGLVTAAIESDLKAKQRARREADAYLAFDQVWCVFDVDQHARLNAAITLAARKGIGIAVSNPCFELWAVLHFADQSATIDAKSTQRLLTRFMPGYRKSLDCEALVGKYADARTRALLLLQGHRSAGGDDRANPSTEIYRLNDALLSAAAASGQVVTL